MNPYFLSNLQKELSIFKNAADGMNRDGNFLQGTVIKGLDDELRNTGVGIEVWLDNWDQGFEIDERDQINYADGLAYSVGFILGYAKFDKDWHLALSKAHFQRIVSSLEPEDAEPTVIRLTGSERTLVDADRKLCLEAAKLLPVLIAELTEEAKSTSKAIHDIVDMTTGKMDARKGSCGTESSRLDAMVRNQKRLNRLDPTSG